MLTTPVRGSLALGATPVRGSLALGATPVRGSRALGAIPMRYVPARAYEKEKVSCHLEMRSGMEDNEHTSMPLMVLSWDIQR